MCGIAGIFDTRDRRPIDPTLVERMRDSMRHRGPDEAGLHIAPGLALAQRRLSIIDLAGGQQPLFNESGSVVVTYNGEIYNFQSLSQELIARGHRFRSHCDTEVIVHGWEEWGEACVERFNGMFAFVLWDETRQTLFLARDRTGEKPLYYTLLPDGRFLFASELKALLVHPGVSRQIDPRAVEDYFAYGYVPDPKSIYLGIQKLPPAHVLTLRRGAPVPEPRPYWDWTFSTNRSTSEPEACEELVDLLRELVKMRMISDVPLGAFLSGGVDSSSIVAMMAGLSNEPVNTCSISFSEAAYDESRFAANVSALHGTRHHVREVTADDFDLVDALATIYDEPFADSSAMPTFRVCALARERVTVALSGDGGDEVFAGYRRYRWHHYEERVRRLVPSALRRPLFGLAAAVYPKADWAPRMFRAKATLQGIGRDADAAYFHSVCVIPDGMRRRLFSPAQQRDLQGYRAIDLLSHHMRRAPTDHYLSQVQYVDLKTYLPGDILTKVDRASMANSLEVRVPFLDHRLLEWAATLPFRLKLNGREGKYLLKQAMRRYIPENVLFREKMGFAVPLARWFRGPLREHARSALCAGVLTETGMFDRDYLNVLVDQHQMGLRDHSSAIWALLMFESFLRQVHGGAAEEFAPRRARGRWLRRRLCRDRRDPGWRGGPATTAGSGLYVNAAWPGTSYRDLRLTCGQGEPVGR